MKVKVNNGRSLAAGAAAGGGFLTLLAYIVTLALLVVFAALVGVWLVPFATAGAVTLGFWQAIAAAVVLEAAGLLLK